MSDSLSPSTKLFPPIQGLPSYSCSPSSLTSSFSILEPIRKQSLDAWDLSFPPCQPSKQHARMHRWSSIHMHSSSLRELFLQHLGAGLHRTQCQRCLYQDLLPGANLCSDQPQLISLHSANPCSDQLQLKVLHSANPCSDQFQLP